LLVQIFHTLQSVTVLQLRIHNCLQRLGLG
jgi:hypothetical protein